jgi:hypothetical protein
MATKFTESARGNEVGFISSGALPRAVVLTTMGAGRWGVTIGSNMIKLLTPSALGRHSTRLIRFYCYFYVTEMVQLGNFETLWGIVKVNDMHG